MEKLGVDGWRESEEIFGSECPYDFCCLQPWSMAITFIIYTRKWGQSFGKRRHWHSFQLRGSFGHGLMQV